MRILKIIVILEIIFILTACHTFKNNAAPISINNISNTLKSDSTDFVQEVKELIVDTIQNLETLEGTIDGQIINVLGYTSKGDINDIPQYIVNTSSTAQPNGGSVISRVEGGNYEWSFVPIVRPEWFGAKGDGITDETTILTYVFNNFENVDLYNSYYITTSGTDREGRTYAILVKAVDGLNLNFKEGAKLVYDRSQVVIPNLINLEDCSNINIENPNSEESKVVNRSVRNKNYHGATVYCLNSENVYVGRGVTKNNTYHVAAFYSRNINVNGGIGINDYALNDKKEESSSFVLIYSSRDCIVENTVSYGGWWDGQISIFGASNNIQIIYNKVIGIPFAQYKSPDFSTFRINQGITIDQGPFQCEVSGNIIDGFFWGIDQKADTQNTNIHDNIILRCKGAIAERKGEAILADKSVESIIQDNLILFSSNVLSAPNGGGATIHEYEQFGILSDSRLSAHIKNNKLMMDINNEVSYDSNSIAGIYVNFEDYLLGNYRPLRVVEGNNVVFQLEQDSIVIAAPEDSVAYALRNALRIDVSNNDYSLSINATTYAFRFISVTPGTHNVSGFFSNNNGLTGSGEEFLLDDIHVIADSRFYSQGKPNNLNCYSFDEAGIIRTYGVISGIFPAETSISIFRSTTFIDDDTTINLSIVAESTGGIAWEGLVHFDFNIDGSVMNSMVTPLYSRNINSVSVIRTGNFIAEIQLDPNVTITSGLKISMEVINSSDNISIENI